MAELSGIDVTVLVKEIGQRLRGSYVNNVFSIGRNQVVRLRQPGGADALLVLSPRFGAWVSEKVSERTETTEFTSRLRAEVQRSRFEGVDQLDLDRVFEFRFGNGELFRKVILEMMPPGNIVVTDSEGRIRLLQREVRSERRRLVKGGMYVPPPQSRSSPGDLTEERALALLQREKTIGSAIGKNVALPRKYLLEVLSRLGLPESTPASDATRRARELVSTVRGLLEEAQVRPRPSLVETVDREELYVVASKAFPVKKEAASVSEVCDDIFLDAVMKEVGEAESPEQRKLKQIEVTVKRLGEQERTLLENAKRLRELASRAGSAAGLVDALSVLNEAGEEQLGGVKPPASKEAVSSMLFKRAKEMEEKASAAGAAAAKLSKARTRTVHRKSETTEIRMRSQEWYEKFRWFFTSSGKLAIGGRDAQSNTLIVRRHLEGGDTVYHADLFGSPFFVLKKGEQQTPQEILEMGQATVSFSSAWKTGLGSADAYWVRKEQVGTSAPSGEYLAKGSFLIKGKKNFVEHNLVQVAVGMDRRGRVVSGPENAVAASIERYIVLTPHREKTSETAKRVARELEAMSGIRPESLDDVVRAMPAGGGKIVRRKTEASRTER